MDSSYISSLPGDFKLEYTFKYYFYYKSNFYLGWTENNILIYNFVNIQKSEEIKFSVEQKQKNTSTFPEVWKEKGKEKISLISFFKEATPSEVYEIWGKWDNLNYITLWYVNEYDQLHEHRVFGSFLNEQYRFVRKKYDFVKGVNCFKTSR